MKYHKFKLGNPCSPCEWHIISGVRVFAWFDFIFQSVFVIPVILGFNVIITNIGEMRKDVNDTKCSSDKADLAIYYSLSDLVNLSSGIVSDVILYIGDRKGTVRVRLAVAWMFLGVCILRQVLHVTGVILHIIRCSSVTYPYEIVVRLLCQYLLYGMWLVSEYILWQHDGCHFVPERGHKELPDEEAKDHKLPLDFPSMSMSDNSQFVVSPYVSSLELLGEGDDMNKTKEEPKKNEVVNMIVDPTPEEVETNPKRLQKRKSKNKKHIASITNSQDDLAPK